MTRLVLLLTLWLLPAMAVYLSPNTKHISISDEYDYVIAGAGIGGLVTAGRLSEDPSGKIVSFA